MAKTLDGFFGLFDLNPCKGYQANEALFLGLQRHEHAALRCASLKCTPAIEKMVKQFGLAADLSEDILSESLVIFLDKIQKGDYQFQGHAPTTFLIEIAKGVALNYTRTLKGRRMDELDERRHDSQDLGLEEQAARRELAEQLMHLIAQMGKPCSDLIRLRYIDGYKDEEVILQQLAAYTSVESLKVTRSQCMKKLRLLAKNWFRK